MSYSNSDNWPCGLGPFWQHTTWALAVVHLSMFSHNVCQLPSTQVFNTLLSPICISPAEYNGAKIFNYKNEIINNFDFKKCLCTHVYTIITDGLCNFQSENKQ